ncbi:MAG: AMP-binding protein, partial [Acidimicrobiales bacterium]
MAEMVSYARRFTDLAAADPDRVLITCGDDSITRAAFEAAANRLARDLQSRGVEVGDMVTIALPNSIEWFETAAAAWKVGAIPQPVSYRLPDAELQAIVELADSKIVAGVEPERLPGRSCLPAGYVPHPSIEDTPLPDVTSPAWKAPTSGGSTGRPKLIV